MDNNETGRLGAFSDGVFAVAITLLVLNIRLPGLEKVPPELYLDTTLWGKLFEQWPALVAYGISFATIGIMWLNHHRLFTHIKRTNTVLLLLNLLLLLIIVFIPVPTALLAEYLPMYLVHLDQHAAVVFYSGTCLIMAGAFNILWLYASRNNRLLGKNVDHRAARAISRQYLLGPILYIITFGVAWINTLACVILQFLLALFFALPGPPSSSDELSEKSVAD